MSNGRSLTRTGTSSGNGASSTETYTYDAAGTFSQYEAGRFANNSFSFTSLTLAYDTTSDEESTESGSNASFTSYERDDSTERDSEWSATGSGTLGTWSHASTTAARSRFTGYRHAAQV